MSPDRYAREEFEAAYGPAATRARARAIRGLRHTRVGRVRLVRLTCSPRGGGCHVWHVPVFICWTLARLGDFRCPAHLAR